MTDHEKRIDELEAVIKVAIDWADNYCADVGWYDGHNQWADELEGWPAIEKQLHEAIKKEPVKPALPIEWYCASCGDKL